MGIIDDDDYLMVDDDEYEAVKKKKEKERSKRLGEEAAPYLKEGMGTSWRTTIVWENEVTHSKRLLFMLGALNMIEQYTNGATPEQIYDKYHTFPDNEYNAMIENLKKYFAKGEELADLLEQQKKNGLGF